MYIYVQKLSILTLYIFLILLAFTAFLYFTRNRKGLYRTISAILLIVAIYGILSFAVLGRTSSNNHAFVFAASKGSEYYREMFMNTLLFFPLGLALTVLIGPWSILAAFVLSFGIESWQYFAGTGLAQGTDVVCNTLGCAIGAIPWFVSRWMSRRKRPAGKEADEHDSSTDRAS